MPPCDEWKKGFKNRSKLRDVIYGRPRELHRKDSLAMLKETPIFMKDGEKVRSVRLLRGKAGNALKQTDRFKYLGSVMNAKGGGEQDQEQDQGSLAKV